MSEKRDVFLVAFDPRWMKQCRGRPEYGRWVAPEAVFLGSYMNWIPITAGEALTVRGWGFDVVYTETRRARFFADPVAAKDARVARLIAEQEDLLRDMR